MQPEILLLVLQLVVPLEHVAVNPFRVRLSGQKHPAIWRDRVPSGPGGGSTIGRPASGDGLTPVCGRAAPTCPRLRLTLKRTITTGSTSVPSLLPCPPLPPCPPCDAFLLLPMAAAISKPAAFSKSSGLRWPVARANQPVDARYSRVSRCP
jgi:hypothetical protein